MNHHAREVYASERDFLISGGGTPAAHAYKAGGFTDDDDLGLAHPTALIPTGAQGLLERMIRFDSPDKHGSVYRSGICVAPGFACGLRPTIPALYLRKDCYLRNGSWTFVDYSSRQCRAPKTDRFGFYVGVYGAGQSWGFLEAVPRSLLGGIPLSAFAQRTMARNQGRAFAADRENGYVDWSGREIPL